MSLENSNPVTLKITMLKAPQTIAVADEPRNFGDGGGSLGRGGDNAWTLDDPDQYVSSKHCEITVDGGRYFLTDLSLNGTFYGGSSVPMEKGVPQEVRDGDIFSIGDYEFRISIAVPQAELSNPFADAPSGFDAPSHAADDFGGFASPPRSAGDDAFGGFADPPPPSDGGAFASGPAIPPDESDPLKLLLGGGSANPPGYPDPGLFGTGPEAPPAPIERPPPVDRHWGLDQADNLPAGGSKLPDDWNDDEPAAGEQAASGDDWTDWNTPAASPEPPPEPPPSRPDPARSTPPAAAPAGEDVEAFVAAMGLDTAALSDQQLRQIAGLGGRVLRLMVSGLMQVLSSRTEIKNAFRMNVTTIQPVENNPLKFSVNTDEALANLFLKQGDSWKGPVESVAQGFNEVKEHQVAVLVGVREAFKLLLERFDPDLLEERFAKQHRGGLLPGSQKARNWDCYRAFYEEQTAERDKAFQRLFGDGFVRAYEDQLQKLALKRKKSRS